MREDDRVADADEMEALKVRAMGLFPLMSADRMTAMMFMVDDAPHAWSEAEAVFAGSMLDRSHVAMDRLSLARERDELSRELVHRMKNILTIAQVIVMQSLREVLGLEAQKRAIASRLFALGAAQDLLTGCDGKSAAIHALIDGALEPHLPAEDRLTVDGPAIDLPSQEVLGLSLALHELATNAAKYGAWSTPGGRVEIAWKTDEEAFFLDWQEIGGPEVDAPGTTGFGSTILNRIVGSYFKGTSSVALNPDGVRFELRGRRPNTAE